jgi:hypothetical protein
MHVPAGCMHHGPTQGTREEALGIQHKCNTANMKNSLLGISYGEAALCSWAPAGSLLEVIICNLHCWLASSSGGMVRSRLRCQEMAALLHMVQPAVHPLGMCHVQHSNCLGVDRLCCYRLGLMLLQVPLHDAHVHRPAGTTRLISTLSWQI